MVQYESRALKANVYRVFPKEGLADELPVSSSGGEATGSSTGLPVGLPFTVESREAYGRGRAEVIHIMTGNPALMIRESEVPNEPDSTQAKGKILRVITTIHEKRAHEFMAGCAKHLSEGKIPEERMPKGVDVFKEESLMRDGLHICWPIEAWSEYEDMRGTRVADCIARTPVLQYGLLGADIAQSKVRRL